MVVNLDNSADLATAVRRCRFGELLIESFESMSISTIHCRMPFQRQNIEESDLDVDVEFVLSVVKLILLLLTASVVFTRARRETSTMN